MHIKPGAFHRFRDPGGVHRITFDPIDIETREIAGRLLRAPVKRANAKATPGKRKSGLGAYAASRAYDQHDVIFCHETLAYLSKTFGSNARYLEQNSHPTPINLIAAGHVAALARHQPAQHGFDPLV